MSCGPPFFVYNLLLIVGGVLFSCTVIEAFEDVGPRAGPRIASPLWRGVRAWGRGVSCATHFFPIIGDCAAGLDLEVCSSDDHGGPASLRAVILAARPYEAIRQRDPTHGQLARCCKCLVSFPCTKRTRTRTVPVLNSEVIEFQGLVSLSLVAVRLCNRRSWRPPR